MNKNIQSRKKEIDWPSLQPEPDEHRLLWITDLHLSKRMLYAREPAAQLSTLMRHFRDFYADIDLIIITGDLSNCGDIDSYLLLKSELDKLGSPSLLLIGNHDDRLHFFNVFPHERSDGGFAQRYVDIGA